jgi:hypothetical protein
MHHVSSFDSPASAAAAGPGGAGDDCVADGCAAPVSLARQSFPSGPWPSAARPAAPQPGASPFRRRLAEGIGSGVSERVAFPSGAVARLVERVTFANGTQVVHKVVGTGAEAHAEVLASLVGHAIGARVPAVQQDGRCELYMELMPGVLAADLLHSRDQERPHVETWSGLLLGVLDAAIDNYDRTAANWIIAEDGTIAGIDHAASFTEPGRPGRVPGTTEPGDGAIRSAFARRWLAQPGRSGKPEWKDNVLHPADVDQWLRAIYVLRPHFDQRGYAEQWQAVVGRLRAIRSHAKGPQPWLAARTRLNSRPQMPKASSSRRSPSPRTAR